MSDGVYQDSGGSMLFDPAKQQAFKHKLSMRKDKNQQNLRLSKFKTTLQKKDQGNFVQLEHEKMALLPDEIVQDSDLGLLYLYFCIRYYDEQLYKVILSRTNNLEGAYIDIQQIVKDKQSYYKLTSNQDSYDRFKLNQVSFEIALDKDFQDVAFHFIENSLIHITWEMVEKMLANRQEKIVKQCIKYGTKFDSGAAQYKKIIFAGRTAAPMEDRQIRLVDFIQIMLELKWSSDEIKEVLKKYYSKSSIDVTDARELFLLFTMKRKLKLMSHMINNDDFNLEFKEANFIDVIENDVFDMGVLLYREYFLEIKED